MSEGQNIQGSLLAKNTVLNFIGQIIPLLVAVLAIPYIIHNLGMERFGILSLAWAVLGYFSMFDLGLGRATTKFVSEALGKGETEHIPSIVWTSFFLQTMMGILIGIVLFLITPTFVERVFNIPPHLMEETKLSFYILSIAPLAIMLSGSFKGLLEAGQRFDLVNAVRIPSVSLIFLLPVLAIVLGFQLPGIFVLLVMAMIGTGFAYLLFCFRVFPLLRQLFLINSATIKPLFTYGGWITISSIIIPVLIYSERFLIGALVSVVALGYYTAPSEIVFRLQIFPRSFAMTLFPAFSTVAAFQKKDLGRLYARSLKYLLLTMGPITLVIILFAGDILELWLGNDFAAKGTLVFQILAVGMLLNALSQMPANLLDGIGRPDLKAKILLSYGIIYFVLAWFLINHMGIVGAALAWAMRGCLELILFFVASWRLLRLELVILAKNGLLRVLIVFALFAAITPAITTAFSKTMYVQVATTVICMIAFASVVWHYALDQTDRNSLKAMLLLFSNR